MRGRFFYIVAGRLGDERRERGLTTTYHRKDAEAAGWSWHNNGAKGVRVFRGERAALNGGAAFGWDLPTLQAAGVLTLLTY